LFGKTLVGLKLYVNLVSLNLKAVLVVVALVLMLSVGVVYFWTAQCVAGKNA